MAHVLIYENGGVDPSQTLVNAADIGDFLGTLGVTFEQLYLPGVEPDFEAGQDEIIESCRQQVNGLMQTHGFAGLDVLMLNAETPELERIRRTCLTEHTHQGDEGRLILSGQAMFCLRMASGRCCVLLCSAGDFLLLPAGLAHWFDPGERPRLAAVRLFHSASGYQASNETDHAGYRPPGFEAVRKLLQRTVVAARVMSGPERGAPA